jgi:hypothetical protein
MALPILPILVSAREDTWDMMAFDAGRDVLMMRM